MEKKKISVLSIVLYVLALVFLVYVVVTGCVMLTEIAGYAEAGQPLAASTVFGALMKELGPNAMYAAVLCTLAVFLQRGMGTKTVPLKDIAPDSDIADADETKIPDDISEESLKEWGMDGEEA